MIEKTRAEKQMKLIFDVLNKPSSKRLPDRAALNNAFGGVVDKAKQTKADTINVSRDQAGLFASCAVEMWHRAVHSFLISAASTGSSPIWASVAGYYSSHYVVRGIAHLLGYFQFHRRKVLLRVELDGGGFTGRLIKKDASDREHKLYWKLVHQHVMFSTDPFFGPNPDDADESDVAHRTVANYYDHVGNFPAFSPFVKERLVERIGKIAKLELTAVPIPNRSKFPDLENVQVVAYHRIVKFRRLLDDLDLKKNKFWKEHRDPDWTEGFLNYQLVDPAFAQVGESIQT